MPFRQVQYIDNIAILKNLHQAGTENQEAWTWQGITERC